MNLEGFTVTTADSEFRRVVRHEAGHSLGFPHQHMRQELIRRLDRDKVIAGYTAAQGLGWTKQEVINQVLTPLEESSVSGTRPAGRPPGPGAHSDLEGLTREHPRLAQQLLELRENLNRTSD